MAVFQTTLKKGSMELVLLHLVSDQDRHGYDIGKLIEMRTGGKLTYHLSSIYPVLRRMEKRGWIKGRWVEKSGERRRRFYTLTAKGRKALASQQEQWQEFANAMDAVLELSRG